MRVLFTGASSFTGMWFVDALACRGHEVTAIFQKPLESYTGLRGVRVERATKQCRSIFSCCFGSDAFISLLEENKYDLLCHHAADVTDYKNPNFDVVRAANNNTNNIKSVLEVMTHQGCGHFLLTGSVFEPCEGSAGDGSIPLAVSPYGLSKGISSDVIEYYSRVFGVLLHKFVIPNPFGPYEEDRFTSYLAKRWHAGVVADVSSPDYVRDNIPVTLLALAYAGYAESAIAKDKPSRINPSYRPDSQRNFATLFASEMEKRLPFPCKLNFAIQTEFVEPKVRINTDAIAMEDGLWDEADFWDQTAVFYKNAFK